MSVTGFQSSGDDIVLKWDLEGESAGTGNLKIKLKTFGITLLSKQVEIKWMLRITDPLIAKVE